MRKILALIAKEIKAAPNLLIVAGHTDARGFHDDSFYSNWELSSARALNTRRDLEDLGIASQRFEQVVGYADRKLRLPNDPLAAENRRISILIKNVDKSTASKSDGKSPTKAPDQPHVEKSEMKSAEKAHGEKPAANPAEKAQAAKPAH
jgi:chemotaxis protein MotB